LSKQWKADLFHKWGNVKKAGGELALCLHICTELRQLILNDELTGIFLHIPTETSDNAKIQYNMIQKLMGRIPGAADYLFLRGDAALAIEIKTPGKYQTKKQKSFQAWCSDFNVPYYVCTSWEAVRQKLIEHGFIKTG